MSNEILPLKAQMFIEQFTSEMNKITGVSVTVVVNYNEHVPSEPGSDQLKRLINLIEQIIDDEHTGTRIRGNCRKGDFVMLRHLYCKVARDMHFTYKSIGKEAGIDHSAAMHGCSNADYSIKKNKQYKTAYLSIMKLLKLNPIYKNEDIIQSHIAA
jgi:hypothetical protein